MKLLTSIICGLALRFVTLALTAASPVPDNVRFQDDADGEHTLKVTLPMNSLPAFNLVSRGKDPSTWWQGKGTVEIWTGGSSRKPVNWGDLRGSNLSDTIFTLLDASCPPSTDPTGSGCCGGTTGDWQYFYTNALVDDDPMNTWVVDLREARVRIEGGCFRNEQTRIVLMQLAADTLRAFTTEDTGYNCYEIPGKWAGTYCNVPQFVRVNLPFNPPTTEETLNWAKMNYMHIETYSVSWWNQFSLTKGELRPCKTRHLVDKVMDKYSADLVKLYPNRGWFHREAKVIIDGDKDCTDGL